MRQKSNADAFAILAKNNTKCIILVATNTYGIGIKNSDVRLII